MVILNENMVFYAVSLDNRKMRADLRVGYCGLMQIKYQGKSHVITLSALAPKT